MLVKQLLKRSNLHTESSTSSSSKVIVLPSLSLREAQSKTNAPSDDSPAKPDDLDTITSSATLAGSLVMAWSNTSDLLITKPTSSGSKHWETTTHVINTAERDTLTHGVRTRPTLMPLIVHLTSCPIVAASHRHRTHTAPA